MGYNDVSSGVQFPTSPRFILHHHGQVGQEEGTIILQNVGN